MSIDVLLPALVPALGHREELPARILAMGALLPSFGVLLAQGLVECVDDAFGLFTGLVEQAKVGGMLDVGGGAT